MSSASPQWIEVEVLKRKDEASGIISLDLRALDGSVLPAFSPGAHIDVRTSSGLIRQYSLCNDAAEQHRYCLGVLLADDSRGGSQAVHAELHQGVRLAVGAPRNLFPLVDESRCIKLIAGGIGITPLLSMAYSLEREGRAFEFHVCARDQQRVSFRDELAQWPAQLKLHLNEESDAACPAFDPQRDIGEYQSGRFIYTCGPAGFMDYIRSSAQALGWPDDAIRMEHFGAEVAKDGDSFTVEARKSGLVVEVSGEQSIAEALQAAGINVPLSCEQGICGMCMTTVLEGEVEHRDMYLTDGEKAANDRMTICCSRATSARLVLDI
jgi:vanillate O-demethylase ferredoxin subunit